MDEKIPLSQLISPPIILDLSVREDQVLKENMDVFTDAGFEIEDFGDRSVCIRAVPADISGISDRDMFIYMLDSLTEGNRALTSELILEKVADMSCKAAIKGNRRYSDAEARSLIGQLLTLDNPFNWKGEEFEKKLKEYVGHTPLQVLAGAILGILVAFVVKMQY